jgi:hypothetical protein
VAVESLQRRENRRRSFEKKKTKEKKKTSEQVTKRRRGEDTVENQGSSTEYTYYGTVNINTVSNQRKLGCHHRSLVNYKKPNPKDPTLKLRQKTYGQGVGGQC